jgi:hypothetical protein
MPPSELRMSFADRAALVHELDSNLKLGRAFLLGASAVEVLADCVLVLVHPEDGHEIGLAGQVVMVSDSEPMRGLGIQLRPFDPAVVQAIEAFIAGDRSARGTAELARADRSEVAADADPAHEDSDGDARRLDSGGEPRNAAQADVLEDESLSSDQDHQQEEELDEYGEEYEPPYPEDDELAAEDQHEGEARHTADGDGERGDEQDGEPGADDGCADEGRECGADLQKQPRRHERLRKLNVTQQYKLARSGELNDRVLLERMYGKGVWEGLLQNPKLTLPEVARIARKGSVPRPLIEQIVENNGWIQSPLVRRALLSNPRVSGEGILKLLRITPRHELKVIYKTTTYSTQVREAARKVLEL